MQIEKIHDVKRHMSNGDANGGPKPPPRVAVIDIRLTRLVSFIIVSVAMLLAAAVCIAAIWDVATHDIAWRALGSLGVIATVVAVFLVLNEGFGPYVRP